MKSHFLLFFASLSMTIPACTSASRSSDRQAASTPSSTAVITAPANALSLDQALKQGPGPTVAYLKSQSSAKPYDGLDGRNPAAQIPESLKAFSTRPEIDHEKKVRQTYLAKFKPWHFPRKEKRANVLIANFQCSDALEAQALGFSLERDFPETKAQELSQALEEKVLPCTNVTKQESLFRLSVFAIQKQQCPKAMEYLKQFPPSEESGVNDRISYLRSLCGTPETPLQARNPWGGYGIHLSAVKNSVVDRPLWSLMATSGWEDWDRLLMTFVELSEKGESAKIRFLATKLNYEKFRTLPPAFQASMMTLMHFASADLSVFQTLHKYLSDHPNLINREIAGLLFPVRFWPEIQTNSTGADPLLVKSLIRQESAFNPEARSRARALGLMQLIYPTARIFGIKSKRQLLEPKDNIRVGSEFLGKLIQKFGSVELALAAYNAGPDIVKDWQKRYPTENIDLFVEMIPYTETREYVRLVTRNYKMYQNLLLAEPAPKAELAQVYRNGPL